jgi:hypothetical protein
VRPNELESVRRKWYRLGAEHALRTVLEDKDARTDVLLKLLINFDKSAVPARGRYKDFTFQLVRR